MKVETPRQRFARIVVARMQKLHGGEYAVIDFGTGPIEVIQGDGKDLDEKQKLTYTTFRAGYMMFGADV